MPNEEVYIVDEQGGRSPWWNWRTRCKRPNIMMGYWTCLRRLKNACAQEISRERFFIPAIFKMTMKISILLQERHIIKCKGRSSPKEIENVLYSLQGILNSVVGVHDEILVRLSRHSLHWSRIGVNWKEIMRFCSQHLEKPYDTQICYPVRFSSENCYG